ncbi:collagen alpha-1(I) chain-like [Enhydra lutris kenyoni]|uniref:Collagen alpha-1(I) chain-like n=1 Tax=Enhydra lutris kenyoni TaxID=391180 RepID=A0A2Y9KBW2_ENHLU|nr:collagen alpha-1(I) chain-like [Enhydra lutris kenyoni]
MGNEGKKGEEGREKSVPRSGSVFPPGPSLRDPGPRSRPGERWKPFCAGGVAGTGRGDWARGGLPRRHMAAAAPSAPRGAAPSSSKVRRLRPAAPEPCSA